MFAGEEFELFVRSARQIVQVVKNGESIVKGDHMKEVAILQGTENGGYSIVVSRDGNIFDIGLDSEISEKYKGAIFHSEIDATGKCVLPGLVDAHTHPVWAGDRVNEFAMKLAGATYMEVHKAGGGIYYTVDHTKSASENELLISLKSRLKEMLRSGTTLVEAKSGYGLDPQSELKMLRVLEQAKKEVPIEISSTFCGAHAVPSLETLADEDPFQMQEDVVVGAMSELYGGWEGDPVVASQKIRLELAFEKQYGISHCREETEVRQTAYYCVYSGLRSEVTSRNMTPEEATKAILTQHLPLLKKSIANGEIQVDNIDVFCEEGVFNVEQSRQILEAGRKMGLKINFHGDELHAVGAAEMGSELQAEAISHLEEISDKGIAAMAKAESVAVILPTTAYMLKLTPPPVRKMLQAGIPVALGSDFNPNAFCLSLPMVMHFACVLCKMTMAEALNASTINAAAALGKSNTHGSLEVGKVADIIIINASRWEHIIYQMGNHSSLINSVIKKGKVVIQGDNISLI